MQDGSDENTDAKRMRTVAALTEKADRPNEIDGNGEYKWFDENEQLTEEEKRYAVQQELQNLEQKGTFRRVPADDLLPGEKAIGTTVVYTRKNGQPRARICVQDFREQGAQDPDLFSATPSATALKVVLAHAARQAALHGAKASLFLADFTAAFPNAEVDKPVKVKPPARFGTRGKEEPLAAHQGSLRFADQSQVVDLPLEEDSRKDGLDADKAGAQFVCALRNRSTHANPCG